MSQKELTDLQLLILSILWDKEKASVADVVDALKEKRNQARTTTATLLSRMEQKGWVKGEKSGKINYYRPLVSREEVQKNKLNTLIDTLFKGKKSALVSHLIGDGDIRDEELAELKSLLERHEGSSK